MEYQDILAQLIDVLTPLAKGRLKVGEDTDLAGELGLDSLQVMDLLLSLEDRFDISVPVNILSDVKTVRDLAVQVDKLAEHD